jgi:hypothetical protein
MTQRYSSGMPNSFDQAAMEGATCRLTDLNSSPFEAPVRRDESIEVFRIHHHPECLYPVPRNMARMNPSWTRRRGF